MPHLVIVGSSGQILLVVLCKMIVMEEVGNALPFCNAAEQQQQQWCLKYCSDIRGLAQFPQLSSTHQSCMYAWWCHCKRGSQDHWSYSISQALQQLSTDQCTGDCVAFVQLVFSSSVSPPAEKGPAVLQEGPATLMLLLFAGT